MPSVPMNVILEKKLAPGGALSLPYPEGKNEGYFFSAVHHTMSLDGSFYRCPRDFLIAMKPDRIIFTWKGAASLPHGALLNFQLEAPGGNFYHDPITGVTVRNMVASPLFMVNLGSPRPPRKDYFFGGDALKAHEPLALSNTRVNHPRTLSVHSENGAQDLTFIVFGEDSCGHDMTERIAAPAARGTAHGNKAFQSVRRIVASADHEGRIEIGTDRRFGLPVFVPGPGFLLREIVGGQAASGGLIVPGETGEPSASSGDRRGLYVPPPDAELNGAATIQLLFSLPNPGNTGSPDYTE